uniref:Uncharacterized protein n=1 Tax=Tanacetum cinerariifolium TaxID=118510 RepID=A0A6L2J5N6_TANCI|nr:hypothetical protein [Tanacetum cinerariifolium]
MKDRKKSTSFVKKDCQQSSIGLIYGSFETMMVMCMDAMMDWITNSGDLYQMTTKLYLFFDFMYGLPKTFWAKATCMTAYVIDTSPLKTLEKNIPAKMWSGHLGDCRMLRVMGSVTYSHVKQDQLEPKVKRKKKLNEPLTYQERFSYEGSSKWKDHMKERMDSLRKNKTSKEVLEAKMVEIMKVEEEEEEEEEEEKEESVKKRSKEASKMGSNSEPPGYAAIDNEVESDLESTAMNEPKCKEMKDTCVKMASSRRSGPSNDENLDIVAIVGQQLQTIIPQIVTQENNNMNNANANGGNGRNGRNRRNNGCSYKTFLACNPRDYDGNGGVVALTMWIEKMEYVIENSGCAKNQTDLFKALLVEEFYPSNKMEKLESEFWNHTMIRANHSGYTDRFHELAKLVPHLVTPESKRIESAILKAEILTDEAVRCGTLTRSSEKRKEMEEISKQGSSWKDNKKTKVGKVFVATSTPRNENVAPILSVLSVQLIQRVDFVGGNRPALEGNQNTQNNRNQARGRAFSVNAVDALQNPNIVTGTFSLNDHFAIVLFISGADFSFISTNFAPLLNVKHSIISPRNVIEVANVCHEKVVRILLEGGEVLRVQGERTLGGMKTLMSTKAEEPELSDIPIVRDFIEVFPEDFLGLPPQQQVEFRIDLIPGATPVVKSPYRLAPSEMQELSEQLQELQTKEDHEVHLKLVLELLKKERLYAKFSKCDLWLQGVHFLGLVVNHNGIHVDPTQIEAFKEENAPAERLHGLDQQMERKEDKSLYFMDRIWVSLVGGGRTINMDEAHKTRYSVHPRADKMYYDLRDMYWWPTMKRDIATYVSKCLTCSKVKVEHQRPSGLLQQPEIPEWKWDNITRDFITKLSRTKIGHDTIRKALGTRLDMSTAYHPQTDGQSKRTIQTLEDMLRACVIDFGGSWDVNLPLAEFSYENSYHSSIRCAPFEALCGRKCRRKPLEFEVRDQVLPKVSLWKGVIHFGKKGKLAPKYVRPFEIIKRVGPVAYRLGLPEELSSVHDTFQVSNLKKCLADANLHMPLDEIKVDKTIRLI